MDLSHGRGVNARRAQTLPSKHFVAPKHSKDEPEVDEREVTDPEEVSEPEVTKTREEIEEDSDELPPIEREETEDESGDEVDPEEDEAEMSPDEEATVSHVPVPSKKKDSVRSKPKSRPKQQHIEQLPRTSQGRCRGIARSTQVVRAVS